MPISCSTGDVHPQLQPRLARLFRRRSGDAKPCLIGRCHTRHDRKYLAAVLAAIRSAQESHRRIRRWTHDLRWWRDAACGHRELARRRRQAGAADRRPAQSGARQPQRSPISCGRACSPSPAAKGTPTTSIICAPIPASSSPVSVCQLRSSAARRHAGCRRHCRCRGWPSTTLAVQRSLRRALLSADPCLRYCDLAPGGGVAAPGTTPSGAEVRHHLRRLVHRIRQHWPHKRLTICGDSHYGRPEVMAWCEANKWITFPVCRATRCSIAWCKQTPTMCGLALPRHRREWSATTPRRVTAPNRGAASGGGRTHRGDR